MSEKLCHSCGTCFVICRHDAISYRETVGGYLFPRIDKNTCTQCGLCYDVCSGINFGVTLRDNFHRNPFVGKILNTQIDKATDETIFLNSQSGGVVTALLDYLLSTELIEAAIVATIR